MEAQNLWDSIQDLFSEGLPPGMECNGSQRGSAEQV